MQRLLSKWFTLTGMNHSFELTHQMDWTFNAPVEKIVTSVDDVRERFPAISKSKFRFTLIEGFSKWNPENSVIELCFFKAIHLPGGSFIYWAHVTSLTCKANAQPTNTTSHTWIDIVFTNQKKKGTFKQKFRSKKSLVARSFKLVNFRHRSSLICSHTFLTGFGHFHGSTWSDH